MSSFSLSFVASPHTHQLPFVFVLSVTFSRPTTQFSQVSLFIGLRMRARVLTHETSGRVLSLATSTGKQLARVRVMRKGIFLQVVRIS
jgi:hypothetical protein